MYGGRGSIRSFSCSSAAELSELAIVMSSSPLAALSSDICSSRSRQSSIEAGAKASGSASSSSSSSTDIAEFSEELTISSTCSSSDEED